MADETPKLIDRVLSRGSKMVSMAAIIGAAIAIYGWGLPVAERLGVRPIFNPEFHDLIVKVDQLERTYLLQRWNELTTKLKVNGFLDAADQTELCFVASQLQFTAPGCR